MPFAVSACPKKLKVTVARFETSAGAVHVKVVAAFPVQRGGCNERGRECSLSLGGYAGLLCASCSRAAREAEEERQSRRSRAEPLERKRAAAGEHGFGDLF